MGRAIPYDEKSDLFSLLGSITELPEKLWAILLPYIDQWKAQYFNKHPQATPDGFCRACHARLRRKILEIIKANEPAPVIPDININSFQEKTAVDIHKFVMKTKKKGKGVEAIISSPYMMKYISGVRLASCM